MPQLSNEQQRAYDMQFKKLKEAGFFLPAQRSLAGNTRYLIVSYGGTGSEALFGIRKAFETVLPEKQLKNQVRFLAIDTDQKTQQLTKEVVAADGTKRSEVVDTLTNDQFVHLSGSAARNCMGDPKLNTWLNPQMYDLLNNDKDQLLKGDGAGGYRQLGRMSLFAEDNRAKLAKQVTKLVLELTTDAYTQLRVLIVTGIAGGTGSGTVIDATYLIRDCIERIPGDLRDRTKYSGFILLPATGNSDNEIYKRRGRRNGYAALKEINHFMTINHRQDKYKMVYSSGQTVESQEAIFTTCYLMDGTAAGVHMSKPRERVIQVLAESLLDMVTASSIGANGGAQAIDSFMDDITSTSTTMITSSSVDHAPRDADYLYCALGHAEFSFPLHEIKAYLAKRAFGTMFALFQKCSNVTDVDAKNFIKNALHRGNTPAAIKKAMDDLIQKDFMDLDKGPYYVINLLKAVGDEVNVQRGKLIRIGFANDSALDTIDSHATKANLDSYSVYVLALETMKELFEAQYNAVVKTNDNGHTYSFIPENLGDIEGINAVIKYLSKILNNAQLEATLTNLLNSVVSKRDEWTALIKKDGSRAAASVMRKFWNDELEKVVDANMENLLIEYFSNVEGAEQATDDERLMTAATHISNLMLNPGSTSANPMLDLTPDGLRPTDFNPHTYLMVPGCAPRLLAALQQVVGNRATVFESLAKDRISCYNQFTSIPTFKLKDIHLHEKIYNEDIEREAGIGLHMSETVGGRNWRNFPSLLPKSTWHLFSGYSSAHEEKMVNTAGQLFDRGLKMHMLSSQLLNNGHKVYCLQLLPENYRPDSQLFLGLDRMIDGSPEKNMRLASLNKAVSDSVDALFALVPDWKNIPKDQPVRETLMNRGVAFAEKKLGFSNSVLTNKDGHVIGWEEYIAKCMLRKLPEDMYQFDITLQVMEKLAKRVDEVHEKVAQQEETRLMVKQFAQYLITDMFSFDSNTNTWSYSASGLVTKLTTLGNPVYKAAPYYFMFSAFRKNRDAITKDLKKAFTAKVPDENKGTYDTDNTAFAQKAGQLRDGIINWMNSDALSKFHPDIFDMIRCKPQSILNFYKALYEALEIYATGGYFVIPGTVEEKSVFTGINPDNPPVIPIVDEDDPFAF